MYEAEGISVKLMNQSINQCAQSHPERDG
uniref:Uncharacterized protein n=1 Tax=Anguilla anguilla TaxID=7936 RepID=A0A0E9Q9K8_ANGAN